jgi:hypothetical protein
MSEPTPENGERIFKAGQFWSSNVCMAMLGGLAGGILLLVVMIIVVSGNPTRHNVLFASVLVLTIVIYVVCVLFGNLSAAYPYAVAIEDGKGLQLYAPLKKLYIPIEDVKDVRMSLLRQGYVVRLRRSHRLLTQFVIHAFWGKQAAPLADAIQEQIRQNNS